MRARLLPLLVVAACSCDVKATQVLPAAEALWGDGAWFCARTADGLQCWDTDDRSASQPQAIGGLTGEVRTVAFGSGHMCALDEEGVACFRGSEPTATRRTDLGDVRELANVSGLRRMVCSLNAQGQVLCWRDMDDAPTVLLESGGAHIYSTTDGDLMCVETADAVLACHEYQDASTPHQTLVTTVSPPVRRVAASTISGEMWVLDAGGLRYGRGQSSIQVGNPFAVSNPLDVEATVRHIPRQTIGLEPVPGEEEARELLAVSIWSYVFDGQRIVMLEEHLGRFEARNYDLDGAPDALLAVDDGLFYARVGSTLVVHGYLEGNLVNREVAGVQDPQQVVVGLYRTCVRHAAGVSCHPNPK